CPLEKREQPHGRIAAAVALLDANVEVLVARAAILQPEPAAGAEVPARKTHERPKRGMVGVEADVAVKCRNGWVFAVTHRISFRPRSLHDQKSACEGAGGRIEDRGGKMEEWRMAPHPAHAMCAQT